ncbi:hypothetical protein CRG98_010221, partial [Punica granatum]
MEPNNHGRQRRRDHHVHANGEGSLAYPHGDLDPWTAWAYRPRTITLLLVGACFLIWASGALDPEGSSPGDIVISVK